MLSALVLLAAVEAAPAPAPTSTPIIKTGTGPARSLADVARERSLRQPGGPRPTAIVLGEPAGAMREYAVPPTRTPLGPDFDQPSLPTTNGAAYVATMAAQHTPEPAPLPTAIAAPSVAAESVFALGSALALVGTVLFVLMWVASPWIGLRIGRTKGYPDWAGALAGLFLGPFVVLMALISRSTKKCPFCLSSIPIAARVCARCQREQPK